MDPLAVVPLATFSDTRFSYWLSGDVQIDGAAFRHGFLPA